MADGGPAFGPWAPLVSAVSGVFGVAISCVLTLRHFAPPPARSLPLISECGLRAPEKYVLLICVDASAFAGGWAILQVDFMLRSTAFERSKRRVNPPDRSDGDCAAVVRAAAGQRFDAIARANAALGLAACTALATTATLGIDRHEFLHSLSAKIFFLGGCGWSWLTTFLLFAKRPRPSLSLVLKVGLAFALSAAVVGFPVYVLTVVGIEKMRLEDRLDA
ncbi:hypothetical protein M885DRAFT_503277, partial [Pelagophyceae sp. CCMP2097]